jgi:DNA-binding IclR family transcriptional regulator
MGQERRNIGHRGAILKRVVEGIIQNPSITLTVTTMHQWLGVPMEAAERILHRLASSGLVKEVQSGTWVRGSLASGPDWY